MARFRFSKMHGLGNDFVVLDTLTQHIDLDRLNIAALADRHRGIGFDQLLLIAPQTPDADFRYRIFNADGAEVEHCGNGARCFVRFVHQHKLSAKNPLMVETQRGMITLLAQPDGQVRVNMGRPSFEPASLPFDTQALAAGSHPDSYQLTVAGQTVELGAVSVGNPHAIIHVADVTLADVATLGPAIESHPRFAQGVNVGFLQIENRQRVKLRVFERGVGETQACGTGACAAVAYARRCDWVDGEVTVELSGGTLQIQLAHADEDLYMTGPATHVYNGSITLGEDMLR